MQCKILPAIALAAFTLTACGGGGGSSSPVDSTGVPDGQAQPSPQIGESRDGLVYAVYIEAPTGDTVAFQVFEPATLTGGEHYPLVLQGHGFSGSRQTSAGSSSPTSPGNIDQLVAAGYGVISIDQRGHGETTGDIRVMDPEFEGKDLLAILDWAEVNLDWLAYGPSADGRDSHNLVLGSIGGSYGGMFQYLIHNIDPKRRLDAMSPQIAPNDLTYSLFPNSVIKGAWDEVLFGAGNTAGSGTDRGHFDPFITQFFQDALTANQVTQDARDFFYYHSNAYFCNGTTVATNGGPGTAPGQAPVRPNDGVNVLLSQGFRDTLFTFNNAYANYQCLKAQGGDVRLLTYQSGHNTLQVVPDPGAYLFQPPTGALDSACGGTNADDATLAFFDQYLKGIHGAADSVPDKPCLSLSSGDAVLVDQVTTGTDGTAFEIPASSVLTGIPDAPVAVDLGYVAGDNGDVIGGIPRVEIDVSALAPLPEDDPIFFIGVGQQRASYPGYWDLIDNQITPVRGLGHFTLDLVGVAERLAPGDSLALLLYGAHDQYNITGSINAANPTVLPLSVSGTVWLPLIGNAEAAP